MEEQSDPQQMGFEQQQHKDNNQPDMDSENPINQQRNPADHLQQQEESPLEEEPPEGEMEQQKINEDAEEEISIQREEIVDEQISEQAEVQAEGQQQQPIESHSQKEASVEEQAPPKDEILQQNAAINENPDAPLSPQQHEQPQQTHNSQQQQVAEINLNQPLAQERALSPQRHSQEEARAEQQKARQAAQEQAQFQAARQAELQQQKIQQNFAYTNQIQQMVESLTHSLSKSRAQEQTLRNANKVLSSELSASKQAVMELRKRKMELQTQRLKQNKELQRLRKQNSDYRDKLAEIQKIGDILLLQSTVEELQALTGAQNQQIEQLKSAHSQQTHNYYQQQLNLLESYQAELASAREKIEQLNVELQLAQNDLVQMQHLNKQLQAQNRSRLQLIGVLEGGKSILKGELSLWQKKWESFEEERAEFKRSRQLDQRVSQYESERFMGEENEVQLIPTLSDREEKNLLLKEYLKLEALHERSRTRAEEAEGRLKRLLRDSKVQQANSIRKKDYQDLLSKYRKAKSCLQGAFAKLKSLERVQQSARDIAEEVDELLEGNQSRLYQALMRRTNEQQQLVSDRINQMECNDEIVTLKRENAKLRQSTLRLQRQLKNNEKILYLVNDELQARKTITEEKTKIIEKLIAAGCHHHSQHYQQRIAELERQLQAGDENLSALQVKAVLLIRENESNLQQISHWRALYSQVKEHLSLKITASLTESAKPVLFRQQPQIHDFCRQCEKRSLAIVPPTETAAASTQTQGNYELQYKEIRESLLCLKRINKEVDCVPESHQKTIRLITEFKDKYEKYIDKYNAKFLELKKERADNEAWRARARQDIREEFQEIREMVSNNRLATALRQAKSLIDYLQNEQEKGQEQEQGEMQQQNEVDEK